jgi:KaiC/GvpD/RAD55 family RecA-like ATPase
MGAWGFEDAEEHIVNDDAMRGWRERDRQGRPNRQDPNQGRGMELLRFVDMQPRLDGRPLVKGLLDREQVSLVFGESGCGKTFFALDIGLHIAAGEEWFGRRVEPGAVVYVAAEAGRSIVNRVAAFKQARELNRDIPFAAITSPIDLCHPQAGDVDRLIALIRGAADLAPLALVEIDTVSRVLAGGNENSSEDMGALVRSLDRLRDELRCHVLAVHHSGKDQSRGSRGHSLLRCAVDAEIEVVRDCGTGVSTATVTKQRDGATDGRIAFRLRQVELGLDQDGEPVTSCIVELAEGEVPRRAAPRLSPAQSRALELLVDAINRDGKIPMANNHIPQAARCVAEDVWRQYCYAGAISTGEQHAKRMAFRRAAEALVSVGRVGKWGEWVWLA